ncbi:hypothetical protein JY651_12250 [Pyxidicoccus parkwayensis]|uniref:Lipoprotein n=1 Tax=Pyxidicoccus parkwayensis TaxID=2813578 RepID=A0ABX7P5C5_9BACT|nr:hypothetical protein [Pyxidicoccus parkwaysis]QSQ25646.1 hypothetical protein JY651_12250 [Pyxidicoccus parkwaysis]
MTIGRFTPAVLTVVLSLVASACGDGVSPCTDCPAIEGRYRMGFGDAGAPAECTQLGVDLPRNKPLDISRTGGALTGKLERVSLRGTVSAQGTFNLTGNAAGTPDGGLGSMLSLTGFFTPPVTDGGTASLAGTYTGNFTRAGQNGSQRCDIVSPFSATRE